MFLESQLKLLFSCGVTMLHLHAVHTLIQLVLVAVVFAAEHVPPTDFFSLLFNVWFGCLAMGIVNMARPLMCALFFPDSVGVVLGKIIPDKPENASPAKSDDGNHPSSPESPCASECSQADTANMKSSASGIAAAASGAVH